MFLILALRWLMLFIAFAGHSALVVYAINRINATGLGRHQIKRIEKLIMALGLAVPAIVLILSHAQLRQWLVEYPSDSKFSVRNLIPNNLAIQLSLAYGWIANGILAPGWMIARLRLCRAPRHVHHVESRRIDTRLLSPDRVFSKPWVRAVGSLPWNQLHLIEFNAYEAHLVGLASPLNNLRIGHLSDLHLTGYMHRDFYRHAIEGFMANQPDVIVFSGDLIDFDDCLNQVQPMLEQVHAPLGCYFVLGNHDRRLSDVLVLRQLLSEIGWHDLGSRSKSVEKQGEEVYLIGNERPWFDHESRRTDEIDRAESRKLAALKIGVAHSPDQLPWARRLGLDLLFCGHTHGGQVRLPIIGPFVAPSWYGSRYASGWFDAAPTLMHVSRGLSGTHPLRIACTPEVSICILRSSSI